MGAGSFGGFNTGAAFMVMNSASRGGGGWNWNEEEKQPQKKFSWLWFLINLCLFSTALYTLLCGSCDFSHYTRIGTLIKKNQSEYKVKQNYYPEYYFTVKWSDRSKETETFEVGGKTFFSCEKNEAVYFNRLKPEYEWVKDGWGVFFLVICGMAWIMSGVAALLKNL